MPYNTLIRIQNMTISATDLLDFLTKAQNLGIRPDYIKSSDGYYIKLYYEWVSDNDYYQRTIFIDNEGLSKWEKGCDETFDSMNELLDVHIEREEQKRIKAKKRKELIDSLTEEQRELLGVK